MVSAVPVLSVIVINFAFPNSTEVVMKRILVALAFMVLVHSNAFATWSVIAVDAKTGQVIIASATCVRQAGFPQRQPVPARDLMDLQAVVVPGIGVAACQAGADNTRQNQMLVYT